MDSENLHLAASLISKSYIDQGAQALTTRRKCVKTLLSERRLPKDGWDESPIEALIQDLAAMDSNNFPSNLGVGEREGRVISGIVARRYYRLAHGIGRSGDITAEQPKAAGSSLLAKLTTLLANDALDLAGLKELAPVVILPLATGMALTMTLLALKSLRPASASYVIWPRIDQKTCLKCITAANLAPVIVENRLEGDSLSTDISAIERCLSQKGADNIVCIMSTTSCFAPRGCDAIVQIAKLCQQNGIPHIVNNAYGVPSRYLCNEITSAMRKGRIDGVIQSTDKNFMVPVGGSIVAAPAKNTKVIDALKASYPGRASVSAHLDLFITLLSLGANGWLNILHEREQLFEYATQRLSDAAKKLGERLLTNPRNPISLALTLDHLQAIGDSKSITFLGSKLFTQNVSGTRVVQGGKVQEVSGFVFQGYGAHHDAYPHHYITVAPFIGAKKEDVDRFIKKFINVYTQIQQKLLKT